MIAGLEKKDLLTLGGAAAAAAVAGLAAHFHFNAIIAFLLAALALVFMATLVGHATDQLGSRMGPGATGILQSALGNLPELFVCIFALRAGLDKVVQAALIGSILGNSLLVFGLAIFLGGLKNGRQTFHSEPPKTIAVLMLLAFAALAIPSVSHYLHTPADTHINHLDVVVAIVLLLVFAASLIFTVKGDGVIRPDAPEEDGVKKHIWPLATTLTVLALSSVGAAFVSDWFVEALQPAMNSLGINETFAGLVVIAIAGNAIENVVGVQLAMRNKPDYAVSVILNSSLQIALVLFPVLVILSFFLGGAILSFILTPMLLICLFLAVLASTLVVFDGESIWVEGVALLGLYILIAAAFWWG